MTPNENLERTKFRTAVITAETLVPLGVLIAVVTAVIAGSVWTTRIDARLTRIEEILGDQQQQIRDFDFSERRWTYTDMYHWVDLFRAENPTIKVPTPEKN